MGGTAEGCTAVNQPGWLRIEGCTAFNQPGWLRREMAGLITLLHPSVLLAPRPARMVVKSDSRIDPPPPLSFTHASASAWPDLTPRPTTGPFPSPQKVCLGGKVIEPLKACLPLIGLPPG